jgi:formyltetrahydrofolate deformylase
VIGSSATLLVSCLDRKGLVARISDFIYRHNGNISHLDQYIDDETNHFLMRVEWDLREFTLERNGISGAFEPVAHELKLNWEIRFSDQIPKMAVFVSKHDHCLYDLLLRERAGELRAHIVLVISNHPDLQRIAEDFGLEYLVFPITAENKRIQEVLMQEELEKRGVEFVVLARYMQVLTGSFVKCFQNRMINIHHSFLPAFVGPRPYHQAYQRGVKLIGATAHYVTEDLDNGPIIAQQVMQISHRDSVMDLIRKGRDLEKLVLARAVRLHLDNRVLAYGNKTAVFD